MRVRFTRQAQIDVDRNLTFLIERSRQGAETFLINIDKAVDTLSRHPHVGRRAEEARRPGVRRYPLPPYILYYRIRGETVEVLRVVHGSQSPDRNLLARLQ